MSDKQPAKVGRPTKRTPETEKKICDFLRTGCGRVDAAVASGISKETFCHWMNEFPEFSDLVLRAESEAAARFTAIVAKAAIDDWRAASWWLERKRREEFGKNETINHLAPNGPIVRIVLPSNEPSDNE